MKTTFIATALAAIVAALAPVAPAVAGGKGAVVVAPVITVSCWRGPWQEVIWDRPNAVFVDSLVDAGYDYPTAHAIAQRICRDLATVGKPEQMKADMYEALRKAPLGH